MSRRRSLGYRVLNRRREAQVGDVGRGILVRDLIRQGVEEGVFPGL